jgi:hypothetical protein
MPRATMLDAERGLDRLDAYLGELISRLKSMLSACEATKRRNVIPIQLLGPGSGAPEHLGYVYAPWLSGSNGVLVTQSGMQSNVALNRRVQAAVAASETAMAKFSKKQISRAEWLSELAGIRSSFGIDELLKDREEFNRIDPAALAALRGQDPGSV